jgi:NitT/TauT family transport system permease protein
LNRIVRKFLDTLPAILLFVGVIVLWELATTVLGVREYLLPGPVTVLESMFSGEINWAGHIWVTGLAIFGAFIIAAVSGVLLGTMIAWSPVIGGALMPFLVFVNTLPKVAVAPLFLLWLGYGIVPNMLIGALIGFFSRRHQHRGRPVADRRRHG